MSRLLALSLLLPLAILAAATASEPAAEVPRLFRTPTLSRTHIVFSLGGDLWSVPRAGGEATRLTSEPGEETAPVFSPDGSRIAFTGEPGGNQDVYVIPAAGGTPQRLTFHPGPDQVLGWSPDGTRILFRSPRAASANTFAPKFQRLFTVATSGGLETALPFPMGEEGCFSPDGSRLAYVPLERKNFYFKRYRGGRTTPIWVARLSDSHVFEIPRRNSTDFNPMWIGGRIYFLSDRDGPVTLFAYDLASRRVSRLIENHGLDLSAAAAGPGAIVYERFGSLHLYDLVAGRTREVKVRVSGEFPEVRPHPVGVGGALHDARLSPGGDRVVGEARGELLIVDAAAGAARNVTRTPGVMERDPAWSPDGKFLAYFSDEGGEYALRLRPVDEASPADMIALKPSFYYTPRWSPDGSRLAFLDKRQQLWMVDRRERRPVRIDADEAYDTFRNFASITDLAPVWSPDGGWLAYPKHLKSGLGAVFLYSLSTGKSTRVTAAAADASHPAFGPNGKRLYFTAATRSTPPGTRRAYFASLQKRSAPGGAPGGGSEAEPVGESAALDLDGITERVQALPVPPRNYVGLEPLGNDTLLLEESNQSSPFDPPSLTLSRLDLPTGQSTPFLRDVSGVDFSANHRTLLARQGDRWILAATDAPPSSAPAVLATGSLAVEVEPRAAWRQMYREVWRLVRDFFYDPGLHGLDLKATEAAYAPYVEGLTTRAELNTLFSEMLGNLTVSHVAVRGGDRGGDRSGVGRLPVGLLGADYAVERGQYRFARIYAGDPWEPGLAAPLAAPGVRVKAGEYLLSVNGQALTALDNVFRLFEGTAGKPTRLRVGPDPDGAGAREETVTPIADELGLRQRAWLEGNRRRVAAATGDRVAYVFVPHTLGDAAVDYDLAAQSDREAVILDARFNLGGDLPGALVDRLAHPVLLMDAGREGPDQPHPAGITGPKVLLINEYAGSGGDALALYFRRQRVGPLVGERTWGGLTGAFGTPELMDGGTVEVPSLAFWGPGGAWEAENRGVAPDFEVTLDPEQVRKGRDPQLEKAIEVVSELLGRTPARWRRPPYPVYLGPIPPVLPPPKASTLPTPRPRPGTPASG
jgi:tricorn protease